ncbi:MAG: M20/M25/M40 family metallo-hydrolase [Deltaproteobacteria bacterium]|nr:M20/M25/M40 family metallo-hydrolase [Deltaproteobacteria bacterium]
MIQSLVFVLALVAAPEDYASKLLSEYIKIRTDHPEHGTDEAAAMWMREAKTAGIEATTWSLDPSGKCVNFIAYLPATLVSPGDPVLLLHHGDTVPAVESEWAYPPYDGKWIQAKQDWELYGRGAIDDKGHGVAHWMAMLRLKEVTRSRDLFFVMNCGEEVSDPLGAQAFVHFLVRPIPESTYFLQSAVHDLTSLDKMEISKVLQKFPRLPKIAFVWNEGSFGGTTPLAPYTLAPIATAQKGVWLGGVTIEGAGGHGALASSATPLEVLIAGLNDLYKQNHSMKSKFRALHSELAEMVSSIASIRPIWERIILMIWPRAFFEIQGMQSMATSWWNPSIPQTNSKLPNVVASSASARIEYRFLGEKTPKEIEGDLRKIFSPFLKKPLELRVETTAYVPFRRDFFEGRDADVFKAEISKYPKVLVTPFITPGITDSRYFRMTGIRAFDFAPFFLTSSEIAGMHGKNERMPHQELIRGIDIEFSILQKLIQ